MGVYIHFTYTIFGNGSPYPMGIHSQFLPIQCNFTKAILCKIKSDVIKRNIPDEMLAVIVEGFTGDKVSNF